MKPLLTLLLFLLLAPSSFGAAYPASCPSEARAIVEAVGGCAAIGSQYEAIYSKCCSLGTAPASKQSPTPPLVPPSKNSAPAAQPSPVPSSESSSLPYALIVVLFWVGSDYLFKWFVRRRNKQKISAPAAVEKKCPYCKSVIPVDATRCSHCQADLRSWPRRHLILTAIAALLVFSMAIYVIGSVGGPNTPLGFAIILIAVLISLGIDFFIIIKRSKKKSSK